MQQLLQEKVYSQTANQHNNYGSRAVFPQANYVSAPQIFLPAPSQQNFSPIEAQSWFPNTAANYHITPDMHQSLLLKITMGMTKFM
jgi:hypothetical protein